MISLIGYWIATREKALAPGEVVVELSGPKEEVDLLTPLILEYATKDSIFGANRERHGLRLSGRIQIFPAPRPASEEEIRRGITRSSIGSCSIGASGVMDHVVLYQKYPDEGWVRVYTGSGHLY